MYSKILEDFLLLTESERKNRLVNELGQENFVPDEVVATLMLSSSREKWPDVDVYAQHLIRRLNRHVRAHVRKNPGWHNRGGGVHATTEDFCADIFELIFKDKAQPCHAEQAFGNYVWKKCIDCADKLYTKIRKAEKSFDIDGVKAEVEVNQSKRPDLFANTSTSPEDYFIEIEDFIEESLAIKEELERIEEVVQLYLTDNERMAFTLHYYEKLRVFSKKADVVTVSKIMGVGESSVRHYLTSARKIIKERLT